MLYVPMTAITMPGSPCELSYFPSCFVSSCLHNGIAICFADVSWTSHKFQYVCVFWRTSYLCKAVSRE